MRLQSIGTRLSSTVGIAVVSSVITTMVLTGGYAVATTVLPDNSVSSINIVDGTIRGVDLSDRLRDRIGRPGPQGPAGPAGPQGAPGPSGASGLREVRQSFPIHHHEQGCPACTEWWFPPVGNVASADLEALTVDASHFPLGATVRGDFYWQASGGEACVRLFDLTAGAPLLQTETCHTAPADDAIKLSERTPTTPLPLGEHRLAWQMRSDACCSYVFDSSLIIEWP